MQKRLQQAQVPLRLAAVHRRTIARMVEAQLCVRHDGQPLQILPAITQLLMNAAHVAQARHMPHSAQHISIAEDIGLLTIDMQHVQQQGIGPGELPLKQGAQVRRRGCTHVFVRIEEEDDIPRGIIQCRVAHRREIILPRYLQHARAELPRRGDGIIRRARIDDHELVIGPCDRGHGAAQVGGLILHDVTGGYLHGGLLSSHSTVYLFDKANKKPSPEGRGSW